MKKYLKKNKVKENFKNHVSDDKDKKEIKEGMKGKKEQDGKACKLANDIKNRRKKFSDDVSNLGNKIKNNFDKNINKGKRTFNYYALEYPSSKFNRFKYLMYYYWQRRYGGKISQRPDLMFLYDVIFGILFIFIIHQIVFRLIPVIKPALIPKNLIDKLSKVKKENIDPRLLAKQNVKMHAIKSHDSFFRIQPFGQATEGDKMTIQYASILMQIFLNLFIFVVLPIGIAYIIWLFIKYTRVLVKASIGLFKTMFRFFFRLVKAAASRKWLIRTVMGWGIVRYPKLGKEHLIPWKKRYIDYWIDRETLRYRILFYKIREKYYYRPKRKYIEIPWANLKKEFFRMKKIYIDLTAKEFWLQVIKTYPQFVTRPENELYLQLYGLDALRKKYYEELKEKIEDKRRQISKTVGKCIGTGYESVTRVSKSKCMCPAGEPHSCGAVGGTAGDLKAIGKSFNEDVGKKLNENVGKPVAKAAGKAAETLSDCSTYDNLGPGAGKGIQKMAAKFPVFIFWAICLLVGLLIAVMIIVKVFGIPDWLKPYISPEVKLAYVNGNKVPIRKKKLLGSILGL